MAKKQNKQKTDSAVKIIAVNRQARHEYIFEEFFEAGLSLQGTEVKSLREGRLSLVDAYAVVDDFNQVWLKGLNISKWHYASCFNHDPLRARRLLLNKSEIRRLKARTHEKGLTIIPTKLYFKKNYIKVEIALSRGKKLYDKREAEAAKTAKRDIERAIAERR
ncbi:MAG: SsrA-binding protein SmpB [Candidatus Bruticola sp.]